MSGMSHHFFSCLVNLKNSLRSDHMDCLDLNPAFEFAGACFRQFPIPQRAMVLFL